ncbi:MAG: Na+/H+ antiporter NhaD/arsenite permease-like protein [Salibacteraceae bacterium]|jgi:Na+/H+ antiporter NhaD/arsenite permease-like protein
MYTLMIIIFVIGYLAIALEHNIHIDKGASALVTGVLVWTVFVFGAESILGLDYTWSLTEMYSHSGDFLKSFGNFISGHQSEIMASQDDMAAVTNHFIGYELSHHVIDIAEILFFLLGAMTIVEVIDAHDGFAVITDKIKTLKKVKLLWILSLLTFFFSAALDNLTTAIVMSALLKKLIKDKSDLWLFAGVVIIAANAGGAWSPIGDVTTIMLWIGGNITASHIITGIFLPSMIALLVPLAILSFTLKGEIQRPEKADGDDVRITSDRERNLVFVLGVASLLFVPVYKTVTHLPPFMGVLFGLGLMWAVTEVIHKRKSVYAKSMLSVSGVIRKVDTPSVMFFLGILLAVGALSSAGQLIDLASWLEVKMSGNIYAINVIIGLLSSIVDNVPLVAGAMGMYDVGPLVQGIAYPVDHPFWEFLAYCAGTGGSALIIGSAAGVAVMGILKIDFMWYMKKISLLALSGYLAGALFYYLENTMF